MSTKSSIAVRIAFAAFTATVPASSGFMADAQTPIGYNNDLKVDVGVGLWGIPIPWDVDGDGLKDLVVTCPDTPYKGTYFFRNIGSAREPLFDKAVKINGKSHKNLRFSEADGKCHLLIPDAELTDFFESPFEGQTPISYDGETLGATYKKNRSNMWNMVDWDNDGDLDIVVGIDTWDDYGWDNAYNSKGKWMNGPLHGYVFLLENVDGKYVNRGEIKAGGRIIDTFGAPCPCVADFDGDGDLDIITGEFRDRLWWYENVGTRSKPKFKKARELKNRGGDIRFHIEMIVPVPTDFDGDGLTDLVVSDEDGSVSWLRNSGKVSRHMPEFEDPVRFQQKADLVKFGALCTPFSYDWDGDGLEDIVTGNSAGDIAVIRNLGGGAEPVWAAPELIRVNGKPFRIVAGENGSIQGPAELKWGYTVLTVADWDGDGNADIIYNSIWGRIEWLRNISGKGGLDFAAPQPVTVAWEGRAPKPEWNWWDPAPGTLTSQWRTTPIATDFNKDGLVDLVMLDQEGYLAFYERFRDDKGNLTLKPGKRIFHCTNGCVYNNRKGITDKTPGILRLNDLDAGQSGRRKLCLADWDEDGNDDIIIDGPNADWFCFVRSDKETGDVHYRYMGHIAKKRLEGHTTCPTLVDWNKDGISDLLIGAEDGHFYYVENPMTDFSEKLELYGKGVMPREETFDSKGYIKGTICPELLVYRPENPNGTAVIVVPGGGYGQCCITYEGYKTANWLVSKDITAFILKYRLPDGDPSKVLEDGENAVKYVRENAEKYGIDPHRVGVIGYSAGGHFAGTLITKYTSPESRPDFAALVYPVIRFHDAPTHSGTMKGMLGARVDDEAARKEWDVALNVHGDMPPTIIFACEDDKAVPVSNSRDMYEALQNAGVPSELHIYEKGGHGFWFRARFKQMKSLLETWYDWMGKVQQ